MIVLKEKNLNQDNPGFFSCDTEPDKNIAPENRKQSSWKNNLKR